MSGGQILDKAADAAGARRTLRTAGLVACLVGMLAMISGRFMPGAPAWLVYAGLSMILFGWGLFALAVLQRGGAAGRLARDVKS